MSILYSMSSFHVKACYWERVAVVLPLLSLGFSCTSDK
jgi:hypothetical protein